MKPAPFVYHDPPDLESALRLLAELGDGARVLAGGQSLMPMLNLRIARPDHLVDLRRITGLAGIAVAAGRLVVGATTTHRTVEKSAVVRASAPLLAEAVAHIGHIPIRERGTLGGSLSLADPAAELPLVSVVLDAALTIESVRGRRIVPASEFFLAAMQTALADDEILTSVSFPVATAGSGSAFIEFSRRNGDFALVGVAATVEIRDGRFTAARIGLCGVSDRPCLAPAADGLIGTVVGTSVIDQIAEAVAAGLDPTDDRRAGGEDRRSIARALVRRALPLAAERAGAMVATNAGDGR